MKTMLKLNENQDGLLGIERFTKPTYPIDPPTSSGGPLLNGQLSDNWVVLESDAAPSGSGPFSTMLPSGIWTQIPGTTSYTTTIPLDGEISSAVITLTEN